MVKYSTSVKVRVRLGLGLGFIWHPANTQDGDDGMERRD